MATDFTLNDFRRQLDQLEKIGLTAPLRGLPGLSEMLSAEGDCAAACGRVRRKVDAMTEEERSDPDRISGGSLTRIAASSGTRPQDVERFLTQFRRLRASVRQMAAMSFWQRLKILPGVGEVPRPGGRAAPAGGKRAAPGGSRRRILRRSPGH
jgi:signal recognition particle subunit SRP54